MISFTDIRELLLFCGLVLVPLKKKTVMLTNTFFCLGYMCNMTYLYYALFEYTLFLNDNWPVGK